MIDFIFSTVAEAAGTANEVGAQGLEAAVQALSGMSFTDILHIITGFCVSFGVKLVKVLLVWFIGRWITGKLLSLVKTVMQKRKTNVTVQSFLVSLIDVVMMFILIVIIISIFGIDTSSFIALFASAGVAIGMALSGTLQNFAGGVIILLFRPYKVGDFIEAQGQAGVVKEIQIFNTVLKTGDNKIILVPNGPISTGIVNNYSREDTRRVDFTFSISYGDDYEKAKAVLEELVAADNRILKSPEPFIALKALGSSSIDIVMRVWASQADYWDIYFDMNKKVYDTFPKRGLNFPYQTFTLNVNK